MTRLELVGGNSRNEAIGDKELLERFDENLEALLDFGLELTSEEGEMGLGSLIVYEASQLRHSRSQVVSLLGRSGLELGLKEAA